MPSRYTKLSDITDGFSDSGWREEARCKSYDTKEWLGPPTPLTNIVCNKCNVRMECLDFAVTIGATCGVWAGVDFADPSERIKHAKKRKKTK